MAGHSQFKNIMHRKGRQDAQKSKLFSKLAREITVAAKLGTPDPAMNARLRNAQGEPHLFVDPRCKELIADFEQVSYMSLDTETTSLHGHVEETTGAEAVREMRRAMDAARREHEI